MPKKAQKDKSPENKKKTKKPAKKRSKLKPVNIFLQIFLFLFIIFASAIAYFAVTISISPKSIPVVTKNIESYLSKATNQIVEIEDSNLHITKKINLKVTTRNLEIIDKASKTVIVLLPEVDIEIPILPMLLGNFSPNKFIVSNANLNIHYPTQIEKKENNEQTTKQT